MNNKATCSICLENINNETENITTLKCKHSFHAECIMMNVFILQRQSQLCPLCRCECIDGTNIFEKRIQELQNINETQKKSLETLDKYAACLNLNTKLIERIKELEKKK